MKTRKTGLPLPILTSAAAAAPLDGADGLRIGLVTLGCDKNTVDSERLMGRLAGAGALVSADTDSADVVLINTCGFIDVAKEESVDAILEAARLKAEGRIRAVVAVGCLVQRYKAELEAEMPEVDLFLGLTEIDRLVPELRGRGMLPPQERVPNMERPLRVISTATGHTSYLKVSEGCDHSCAFCAIPLMRGKHRSTPIEALVREARELEAAGVVELNLVSQDTTWYGRDLLRGGEPGPAELFVGKPFQGMANVNGPVARPDGPGAADRATATAAAFRPVGADLGAGAGPVAAAAASRPVGADLDAAAAPDAGAASRAIPRHGLLPQLLRSLLDGTSIPWLRLFYMYPSGISRELVALMAAEPRILPYLDMPIQHGSDAVLRRMRRPERRATIRERVGWLRAEIPDLVLRTTIIVGFPGEEEEDVDEMLELLEEIGFDHLGAFAYSPEEGTPAAGMAGQVPPEVSRERLERVLDLQRSISLERNERWLGRETIVLVDRVDPDGGAVGRTAGQALEVDGIARLAPAAPNAAASASRGTGAAAAGSARGTAGAPVAAPDAGPVRAVPLLQPGRFVRARITGADERDLAGVVLGGVE